MSVKPSRSVPPAGPLANIGRMALTEAQRKKYERLKDVDPEAAMMWLDHHTDTDDDDPPADPPKDPAGDPPKDPAGDPPKDPTDPPPADPPTPAGPPPKVDNWYSKQRFGKSKDADK